MDAPKPPTTGELTRYMTGEGWRVIEDDLVSDDELLFGLRKDQESLPVTIRAHFQMSDVPLFYFSTHFWHNRDDVRLANVSSQIQLFSARDPEWEENIDNFFTYSLGSHDIGVLKCDKCGSPMITDHRSSPYKCVNSSNCKRRLQAYQRATQLLYGDSNPDPIGSFA